MAGFIKSLILILVFVLFASNQSFAGLIVEREKYEQNNSQRVKATIYIQENKMKFFDEQGQFYAIFDLNSGQMIQVDNVSRTYSTTKAEDYFDYYKQYAKKMESAMREQLSELPPNKRAQAEAMMKRQGINMPANNPGSSEITVKRTGDTSKVAGYESAKYEIYKDGQLYEELWVTSDERFANELDLNKMSKYLSELTQIEHNFLTNNNSSDEIEKAYIEVFKSGFPMKIIDYPKYGNAIVENTAKVSNKNIDSAEFEAPLGYKKVELEEMLQLGSQ
ncbi:MAG: DUF4412 domain-containing protein [Thermodesulfobacteriota bacterium]